MDKYLPDLKSFFNFTLYASRFPLQKGFAIIPLVVLLLVGITAAVYLTQTRTNFLPQAQEQWSHSPDDPVFKTKYETICYTNASGQSSRNYQVRGRGYNGFHSAECENSARPCVPGFVAFCQGLDQECQVISPFEAQCSPPQGALQQAAANKAACTDNVFIQGSTRNNCTHQGRVCSAYGTDNGCPKPTIQAECDSIKYFKDYGFVYNSSHGLCELPDGTRSNSGTCSSGGSAQCTNGKTCKDLPCPADNSKQCYICTGSTTASAAQPAAQPASQQASSSNQPGAVKTCTTKPANCKATDDCKEDNLGVRWCVDPKWTEGGSCGEGCVLINGLPKKPYPGPGNCIGIDAGVCPASEGKKCSVLKKDYGGGKIYYYSACEKTSDAPAAPAAAQPQRPGAPAAAPAAPGAQPRQGSPSQPASTTGKTPWDIDSDGNSNKVSQVFAQAAKATSGSTDKAVDIIDAGRRARQAYILGFDEAYKKVFTAEISADADARTERDKQANYVAIHAYLLTENPTRDWSKVTPAMLEAALDNLQRNSGVIPLGATVNLKDIKAPNAVPGTTGTAPSKLTIDPGSAVDCGFDKDGTKVPCYQIGVFASYDNLKATEAQASIATQRYVKSQEILNAVKDKVNTEIWNAAQTKLNAAKDKAAACMKK